MGMQTAYKLALSATIFTVLFTCGGLHPSAATAATYYVATTGNDANPGTQAQPFQTIKKGLSVCKAGDTLYLRGGTYNESIDANVQRVPIGNSWADAPVIASYPSETAIINRINLADDSSLQGAIQYIIFDRIVVGIPPDGGGISIGGNTNHIRFQNGEVQYDAHCGGGYHIVGQISSNGTNIELHGHHNEFLHSKVHNSWCGYGFYAGGHDNIIDGNDIYDNAGYGIQLYDGAAQSGLDNYVIRNNRFWGNGFVRWMGAMTLNHGTNGLVYNNLVYNNYLGIEIDRGMNNLAIYNNTIYNNQVKGIEITNRVTGALIKNNIVYQNGGGIVDQGINTIQSNNLTVDPKFVNASATDFTLKSTSPAIDAGITLSAVPTDIKGLARPQGARYTIGAYEYAASQPPTPTVQFPAPKNLRTISVTP
jgi:parallel beta-helix repeat protein